jgi:hypothetical protein
VPLYVQSTRRLKKLIPVPSYVDRMQVEALFNTAKASWHNSRIAG